MTQVISNTVVSNTADLDAIVAEAKAVLDQLMQKPQPLTDRADQILAALNLTIVTVGGGQEAASQYAEFASENEISVLLPDGTTYVRGQSKPVDWKSGNDEYYRKRIDYGSSAFDIVSNIRAIQSKFAEYN